jgi:hypothetical protein
LREFESRELREMFEPKRDEVKGERRKLHNEDLHNLFSSPNIVRVTNPRRMRWAGHVARMEEMRNACKILVRKPQGKRQTEVLGVDGGNIKMCVR